jgi:quinol-cytochrome oxidoreductase complex cytochrome b subunit
MLKLVYKPFPGMAYGSILFIQREVPFGLWVRNIHHWSANFLAIVLFLHMQRVFFTGGFRHPRQFNWVVGLVLFLLVLASNFTGYLLPWDQLAYWAVTISTGMLDYVPVFGGWLQTVIRGGAELGPTSLLLFFALHTAFLPMGIFMMMIFHFWRVRKAGGVAVPLTPEAKGTSISVFPDLMLKELVTGLWAVAFVLVFSILFNAPLEMQANPGLSPNPAKAPWFFIGMQELLLHIHPVFSVLIIPLLMLGWLLLLPYMTESPQGVGVWFYSEKGRRLGILSALAAIVFFTAGILVDEFLFDPTKMPAVLPPFISDGLLPIAIFSGLAAVFLMFLKRRFAADINEMIQSIYIFLMTGYVVLTITCLWFRGANMALAWPW